MTTTDDLVNAYVLAGYAECGTPERPDSPGAQFLLAVQDDAREAWNEATNDDRLDLTDEAHMVADDAVPIYTHDVWATFVDLAAYQEDPTEHGTDGSDMEQAAKMCLYMIAERLAITLWDDWNVAAETAAEWLAEAPEVDAEPVPAHVCQWVDAAGHATPRRDADGAPVAPKAATCGACHRTWCERCDPCPSAMCPWCNGAGGSSAPMAAP